jgi:hypothetical protein
MENRAMQSPPFRDAKFFLPAQKSPSRGIGILTDGAEIDGDDIIASKFIIHEFRLAIMRNDGRLMFGGYCAFPTDRPKVYTVDYNVTDTELANTGIPIDLLNHTPDNYEFKAPKDRYTGACRSVGAIEI